MTFSGQRIQYNHPCIFFDIASVDSVQEQKHWILDWTGVILDWCHNGLVSHWIGLNKHWIGVILDSKLSFASRIQSVISKCRQGIGMLRFISEYLPRHTRNEMYRLYVRQHLDYGDIIYHIPQNICEFSQIGRPYDTLWHFLVSYTQWTRFAIENPGT